MPRFDEDLAKAVSEDMAKYVGEVMSSVSFRSNAPGVNGIRTNQVFSRFGWGYVRHPYRVGSPEESDVFKAFGVVQKMTPSASKVATTKQRLDRAVGPAAAPCAQIPPRP